MGSSTGIMGNFKQNIPRSFARRSYCAGQTWIYSSTTHYLIPTRDVRGKDERMVLRILIFWNVEAEKASISRSLGIFCTILIAGRRRCGDTARRALQPWPFTTHSPWPTVVHNRSPQKKMNGFPEPSDMIAPSRTSHRTYFQGSWTGSISTHLHFDT